MYVVELVRNPHNDAGCIRPIRRERVIVCQEKQLAVDAATRERERDRLLAPYITLGAQVAPAEGQVAAVEDIQLEEKGQVFQMSELGSTSAMSFQGLLSSLRSHRSHLR
jgi:hypothetical protein